MELTFSSDGIALHLKYIEMDAYDSQSIKFEVKLTLEHPTGVFTFSADDIWFEADMWNQFVHELNNGLGSNAVFHDQSNYLRLSIERAANHLDLSLSIREPLIAAGDTTLSSSQRVNLDSAFINSLTSSFQKFPKLW